MMTVSAVPAMLVHGDTVLLTIVTYVRMYTMHVMILCKCDTR